MLRGTRNFVSHRMQSIIWRSVFMWQNYVMRGSCLTTPSSAAGLGGSKAAKQE